MYEYAYNTSRAIPLRTASNELYFYANEAGRNGVLSYNIMNELNHTGNKNDNSAIDVAVNLDWKVASWMRFSSILGLSRSNATQENWVMNNHIIFLLCDKVLWEDVAESH